jgi:flagellar protein FliO/FliZ
VNAFLAVLIVLGLVAGLAWLLRRGSLGALTGRGGAITVETAVALGERRSLVIVAVEGRRLLLGLTPTTMSLVAELPGAALQTPPAAPARESGA